MCARVCVCPASVCTVCAGVTLGGDYSVRSCLRGASAARRRGDLCLSRCVPTRNGCYFSSSSSSSLTRELTFGLTEAKRRLTRGLTEPASAHDACAAIPRQGRTHGRRVGGDFGRACYGASAAAKTRQKSSSFRLAALHHLCNEADITATALITRELTGSGRSPQDPEKSVEVLIWRCQGLCRRTPRSRVGLSGSRPALSVVEAANHLLEEGARSGSRVGGIRLES